MGILEILLLIFIVLKLLGLVAWSWTVVLIPLWILLFFIFVGVLINAIFSR